MPRSPWEDEFKAHRERQLWDARKRTALYGYFAGQAREWWWGGGGAEKRTS